MKKTKLLTSIAALALVVSLGACGDVTINVGDVDVDIGGSSETTSEDNTSEDTSEDDTSEDDTSENTSGENPGTGDEETKKAADLEAVQEALKGLGNDPFNGWEGYKYVYIEDDESETRLLATDSNNNLIGYSIEDEMTTYYLDGVAYIDFDGDYFTEEVEEYDTVADNLEEDGWFVIGEDMAIETITSLEVDDVSSVTIADNTYTVSYETFEDQYVLGTMTYQYTTTFVIISGALVSAKSESTQIHTAGTVGEGDYTKEVTESIEKVDPTTVTEETLIAAGFNQDLWVEDQGDEDAAIAKAILDNILGKTPDWEAFYGYAEDDWDGPITEYLTVDSDGNLYGYKDSDDFDDDTYTYYYYGGYRCMYSYNGHQAQTPAEVYTTYEEELEFFTSGLEETFDLSDSDHYELNELDGGYELTVLSVPYYVEQEAYTFTVDSSYNLLAIDRDTQIISHSDLIVTSHVEGITYADVEQAMAETSFDPDDFGLGDNEPEDDQDLKTAQEILDAVNDGISWDAFHGEYIDEGYDEAETVYLTEDDDGAYGSVVDYEDDEVTFAYYYQNGKEYEYAANRNAYNVYDQWDEFDDCLDEYTDDALEGAEDFDLESDSYQLKEYGDGYELIVTTNFMGYYDYEYIYIVDEDFNVIALAYGEYFAGNLEGYYVEETTYDEVAASMEDFDLSDWGIGSDDDEDLEIALSIIEWAAETDEYDIPEMWEAVHIDDIEYDWDEEDEYWITTVDDALYGRFEQSGIEDTSYAETRYFMSNYYFSIQDDEGDVDYDYDTYYEDYEDIIDAYTYPITDAQNFLDEDDEGNLILSEDVYGYTLTENSDGGYTLKVIYSDWWGRDSTTIYTYTTDENLDVYKIEYEEGTVEEEDYEYNLLEWIDYEDVQAKMSDFDINLWID